MLSLQTKLELKYAAIKCLCQYLDTNDLIDDEDETEMALIQWQLNVISNVKEWSSEEIQYFLKELKKRNLNCYLDVQVLISADKPQPQKNCFSKIFDKILRRNNAEKICSDCAVRVR